MCPSHKLLQQIYNYRALETKWPYISILKQQKNVVCSVLLRKAEDGRNLARPYLEIKRSGNEPHCSLDSILNTKENKKWKKSKKAYIHKLEGQHTG